MFGLDHYGDPELNSDSKLHICQDLSYDRSQHSESTLADSFIDLKLLLTTLSERGCRMRYTKMGDHNDLPFLYVSQSSDGFDFPK